MLLIAAAPVFFFAAFLVKQRLVQNEMEESLEHTSLQTIIVDQADFQWIKKDKEIIVDGRLFDVKSYIISGGQIEFTGLFDEDEDKLKKRLNNFIEQKDNGDTPLNDLAEEFFSLPINSTNAAFAIAANWHYITIKYRKFSENLPDSPYLSYSLPPKL
jgi:hypothetical protein